MANLQIIEADGGRFIKATEKGGSRIHSPRLAALNDNIVASLIQDDREGVTVPCGHLVFCESVALQAIAVVTLGIYQACAMSAVASITKLAATGTPLPAVIKELEDWGLYPKTEAAVLMHVYSGIKDFPPFRVVVQDGVGVSPRGETTQEPTYAPLLDYLGSSFLDNLDPDADGHPRSYSTARLPQIAWKPDAWRRAVRRIGVMNAAVTSGSDEQQKMAAAFNGRLRLDPTTGDIIFDGEEGFLPEINVLFANEVAYEGVDLQVRTCSLHHLDLPWEPATFCVPVSTEALTERGWKLCDELTHDDRLWTLNTDTGKKEWQAPASINTFPAVSNLVRLEGPGVDFTVTPNHRWPVTTAGGAITIKRTDALHVDDALILENGGSEPPLFSGALSDLIKTPVENSTRVWCPTTANGTWLARSNGTVAFTGNTQRNGRAVRQGNLLGRVDIYAYVTDGTVDFYKLSRLNGRKVWLESVLAGTRASAALGGATEEDLKGIILSCTLPEDREDRTDSSGRLIPGVRSRVDEQFDLLFKRQSAQKLAQVLQNFVGLSVGRQLRAFVPLFMDTPDTYSTVDTNTLNLDEATSVQQLMQTQRLALDELNTPTLKIAQQFKHFGAIRDTAMVSIKTSADKTRIAASTGGGYFAPVGGPDITATWLSNAVYETVFVDPDKPGGGPTVSFWNGHLSASSVEDADGIVGWVSGYTLDRNRKIAKWPNLTIYPMAEPGQNTPQLADDYTVIVNSNGEPDDTRSLVSLSLDFAPLSAQRKAGGWKLKIKEQKERWVPVAKKDQRGEWDTQRRETFTEEERVEKRPRLMDAPDSWLEQARDSIRTIGCALENAGGWGGDFGLDGAFGAFFGDASVQLGIRELFRVHKTSGTATSRPIKQHSPIKAAKLIDVNTGENVATFKRSFGYDVDPKAHDHLKSLQQKWVALGNDAEWMEANNAATYLDTLVKDGSLEVGAKPAWVIGATDCTTILGCLFFQTAMLREGLATGQELEEWVQNTLLADVSLFDNRRAHLIRGYTLFSGDITPDEDVNTPSPGLTLLASAQVSKEGVKFKHVRPNLEYSGVRVDPDGCCVFESLTQFFDAVRLGAVQFTPEWPYGFFYRPFVVGSITEQREYIAMTRAATAAAFSGAHHSDVATSYAYLARIHPTPPGLADMLLLNSVAHRISAEQREAARKEKQQSILDAPERGVPSVQPELPSLTPGERKKAKTISAWRLFVMYEKAQKAKRTFTPPYIQLQGGTWFKLESVHRGDLGLTFTGQLLGEGPRWAQNSLEEVLDANKSYTALHSLIGSGVLSSTPRTVTEVHPDTEFKYIA